MREVNSVQDLEGLNETSRAVSEWATSKTKQHSLKLSTYLFQSKTSRVRDLMFTTGHLHLNSGEKKGRYHILGIFVVYGSCWEQGQVGRAERRGLSTGIGEM